MKVTNYKMYIKDFDGKEYDITDFRCLLDVMYDVCQAFSCDESNSSEQRKAASFVCKWIMKLFILIGREKAHEKIL